MRIRPRPSSVVFVDRDVLEDPRLSLAAKGLYAVVASWQDGQSLPTEDFHQSLLDELVAAGYAFVAADGEVVVGHAIDEDEPTLTPAMHVPAPRPAAATIGWAYAITDAEAERVKIGVTQNVAQRLKGLQTGYPTKLRVLWQGDGGAAMEAHLHARFVRRRLHGEWFDFSGVDALKLITQAAKSFREVTS